MEHSKRLECGYVTAMNEKQSSIFKLKYQQKSLWLGTFLPLSALGSIYISLLIAHSIVSNKGIPIVLSLLFVIIATLFITRQFRYLENVVHFGSHYNVSKNKGLNDWIVNVLAAFPTMQNIGGYRKFHRIHHAFFGGKKDPCKIRFSDIGDSAKGFTEAKTFLKSLVNYLPKYIKSYYKDVGSNFKTVGIWIFWHTVVFTILWALFGTDFLFFSLIILSICFFILLPIVRYIAEISEHDYLYSNTEFGCTFNNLSILDFMLFHPGGDAYHLVHHLYPNIPWWLQGKAHRFLCEYDYCYKIAHHRSLFLQSFSVAEERNQWVG